MTKDHKSTKGRGERGNTKVWTLGEQYREVFHSFKGWGGEGGEGPYSLKAFLPRVLRFSPAELVEQKAKNRERNDRRARSMIRRYALAYNLRYMWSLTIAEEVTDLGEAWRMFTNFVRRMKYAGLMPSYWVAVPERQQRGVWHFHVVCNQYVKVRQLREAWGHGFVWVNAGKADKAAGYAAKYIGKSLEENEAREEGQRRFRNAKGMREEEISTHSLELTDDELADGKLGDLITEGGFLPVAGGARPIEIDGEQIGMWFLCALRAPESGAETSDGSISALSRGIFSPPEEDPPPLGAAGPVGLNRPHPL